MYQNSANKVRPSLAADRDKAFRKCGRDLVAEAEPLGSRCYRDSLYMPPLTPKRFVASGLAGWRCGHFFANGNLGSVAADSDLLSIVVVRQLP